MSPASAGDRTKSLRVSTNSWIAPVCACAPSDLARFTPAHTGGGSVIARVLSSSPVLFEDGLGQRKLAVGVNGDHLEVLSLRDELTASPLVEVALRERGTRLTDFQSEHFGRVRAIERTGKPVSRLVIVSDHVPGVRLSTVLAIAERHLLPIETLAALCLLRQLVHAIAVLHEKAPDVCHGVIGPERIVVTPHARLVVTEYVLGSAIEQLRYSNKQYWKELRVPLPRTFGMPHLDRRTDVTQVGATALALVMGRPLSDDDFPDQISEMTANALALSADGTLAPLPLPFRVWLQRALQIDSKTPFGSAPEAWAELDRALHYSDPIAEIEALQRFMARYHAVAAADQGSPAPSVPPSTSPGLAPPVMQTPNRTSASAVTPPASPAAPAMPSAAQATPAVQTATAPPATAAPAQPASASNPGFGDKPAAAAADTPAPAPAETLRQSVPAERPMSRFKLAAAAVLLIALTSAVTLVALRYMAAPVAADGMGLLVVQTNPSGAAVDIDGQGKGVTPLSLALSPGRHTLKLANEGNIRTMPVVITAGGQVSQLIDLPRASSLLGELQVRTEPAGAQVTVDGHPYGAAPVTVEGLAPGAHTVVLQNDLGSMTQEVKIEAGTTASLVVPLAAAAPKNANVSGWIAVSAPVPLQVFEDSRLLGTSESDRIMVSVGRHTLRLVNESIVYREGLTINVAPGRVTAIKPRWPTAPVAFNASPWAEVWVDGRQVGETPIGNITLPIGPHDVLFRHPELGEKSVRVMVTLTAPVKVTVDMKQR